jgi:ribonuclease E
MTRKMIINAVDPEEVRIAILNGRTLEDFDLETRGVEKNKGNIYKGVVMAVEPALNAAFVNYGADKQGFLTANDVHQKYAGERNGDSKAVDRAPRIDKLLKPKQTVLVQVSKDEVSAKGAVLTTFLSLAGRYLVLMPDSETQGVSRKIDDEETRRKVREAAAKLIVPDNMGVIIRTAGRDRTKLDLNRDLRVLLRLWENIQKAAARTKGPALIFKEQDVIIRALRDYFSVDIDEIVLDSDDGYDRASEYMHLVMPNHRSALTRYVERRPIFHHYKIEEQLNIIYAPKVTLPSGGSVVIESTEALVAVDVNSGKQKSGNQEETALQTNTEAATEVARQLRLRDLGGIIVVDFIDMAQRKNQQKVERVMKEALRFDKARVKVARISRNGTLEITRQRIRSALQASVFDTCSLCRGTGHTLNPGSHAIAVLRRLRDRASRGDLRLAKILVEPEVANRLRTEYWSTLQDIEKRYGMRVEVSAEHSYGAGKDDFTFETNPDAVLTPLEEPNFGPAPRPHDYDEAAAAAEAAEEEEALRLLSEETFGPEPEDDDSDDDLDIDAEDNEEEDMSETPIRRDRPAGRRPGRSTGRAASSDLAAPDDPLGIPNFEFIDPASLARTRTDIRPRRSTEGRSERRPRTEEGARSEPRLRRDLEPRAQLDSADRDAGRPPRRRRRRRPGDERPFEAHGGHSSAPREPRAPAAPPPEPAKKGFFARLFGL